MSNETNCVEKEKCEQEKGCTTIIKQYYGCGGNSGCSGSEMDLSDYATVEYVDTKISEIEASSGEQGIDGKSAYELAVENGFEGTLEEWLASLCGEKGDKGEQGLKGDTGAQGLIGISALSPHNWPIESEVNLGDGSYGYRWIGTISGALNIEVSVVLAGVPFGAKPINYGGWWNAGTAGQNTLFPMNNGTGTGTVVGVAHISADGNLYFRTKSHTARTNAPYDIWVRYSK